MNITTWITSHMELAYILGILGGAVLHWARSYKYDPVGTGKLWDYWLQQEPGASMCTAMVLLTAIGVGLNAGLPVGQPWLVVTGAIGIGYGTDSFFNKGSAITADPATKAK